MVNAPTVRRAGFFPPVDAAGPRLTPTLSVSTGGEGDKLGLDSYTPFVFYLRS